MFGIDDAILIPAAVSAFGSILGAHGQSEANYMNSANLQASNFFNAEQSQLNRAFQERMRGSQYQAAVSDMAAAGLNPMLAYHQGGAGTPSGSAASGHAPPAWESPVSAGLSSGQEAAKVFEEIAGKEQERKIKKPVENIAGAADKGIEAVKDLVRPLSESVSEVVRAVEDKVKAGSLSSAAVDRVERVVEGAKSMASDIGEKVLSPYKTVGKAVSSAGQVVRGELAKRENRHVLSSDDRSKITGKFEGSPSKVFSEI